MPSDLIEQAKEAAAYGAGAALSNGAERALDEVSTLSHHGGPGRRARSWCHPVIALARSSRNCRL